MSGLSLILSDYMRLYRHESYPLAYLSLFPVSLVSPLSHGFHSLSCVLSTNDTCTSLSFHKSKRYGLFPFILLVPKGS